MTLYNTKKTDEEKLALIRKYINNAYVPYEKKADVAKAIIDNSYYKDEIDLNGKSHRIFHIDSVAKYMLTCMAILDLYTTIERSKGNGKMLEDFNLLNEHKVLDLVIQNVDDRELKEFNMVLQMTSDDVMTNEYENHAFISKQLDRFGELINVIITQITSNIDISEIDRIMHKLNIIDKNEVQLNGKNSSEDKNID